MFDKQVDNARANLSMGHIREFQIPLPEIAQQTRISKKIHKILNSTNSILTQQTQKLNHLKSLKSSLLDLAFKGELV